MTDDAVPGRRSSRRGFLPGLLVGAVVVGGAWAAIERFGPGLSSRELAEALGVRSYSLTIPENTPRDAWLTLEWRRGLDAEFGTSAASIALETPESWGNYRVLVRDPSGSDHFEIALLRHDRAFSRFTIEKPTDLQMWSHLDEGASVLEDPVIRGSTAGRLSTSQRLDTDLTLHFAIR